MEHETLQTEIEVKIAIANPCTILLEIIELQSGDHLGEDEKVRFEDTYGRTNA